MAWNTVNKPTSLAWTTVNPMGKEQYDQSSLMYDDPGTYYDGVNPSEWTDVPKPTGGVGLRVGVANGLLIPLTRVEQGSAITWTSVPKPTAP